MFVSSAVTSRWSLFAAELRGRGEAGIVPPASAHQPQAPATCLVATLRRLKTLVVAIMRSRAASPGSS
jgi:hypothetical protein